MRRFYHHAAAALCSLTVLLAAPLAAQQDTAQQQPARPRPFRGTIELRLGYLDATPAAEAYFRESLADLAWVSSITLLPDPAFPTAVILTRNNSNPDIALLLQRLRARGIGVSGVQLTHYPAMRWVTQLGHLCGEGSLEQGVTPAEGCARCKDTALNQIAALPALSVPSAFVQQHRLVTDPPAADVVDVGAYLDALERGGKPAVSLVMFPAGAQPPAEAVAPVAGLEPIGPKDAAGENDPLISMVLGHACCNRCAVAIYHALNQLPWATATRVMDNWSFPRATMRVTAGVPFDLMQLHGELGKEGMTVPQLRLDGFGAVRMDIGFVYLPDTPSARRALARALARVDWAASVSRITERGVRIELPNADTAEPETLIAALAQAGFPPSSLLVTPRNR